MLHALSVLGKKQRGELRKRKVLVMWLPESRLSFRKNLIAPCGGDAFLFYRCSRPKLPLDPDLLQFNFNRRPTGATCPISGSVTLFFSLTFTFLLFSTLLDGS
jgi:hypothetical protein